LSHPVTLTRCVSKPALLEYDINARSAIEPIISLASRGQHVLTRREILRYITSDGSTRAQQIQELLNLSEVENIRQSLVKVKNKFQKEFRADTQSVQSAEGAINATAQIDRFDQDVVLGVINRHWAVLGALPVTQLRTENIKAGISLPTAKTGKQSLNVSLLEKDIHNLMRVVTEEEQKELGDIHKNLCAILQYVRTEPDLLRALSQRELVTLGLQLLDDSGRCPLCDHTWPSKELQEHLEQKLLKAQRADKYQQDINALVKDIAGRISLTIASLQKVIAASEIVRLGNVTPVLQSWEKDLQFLHTALNNPIEEYIQERFDFQHVQCLFAPSDIVDLCKEILDTAKAVFPESTPEQTSWDTLTRLEENLKVLEKARSKHSMSTLSYQRAQILLEKYEQARDVVLRNLYDEIKDRFVSLYRKLHEDDESNFTALIDPEGAALHLQVDFYGRGIHPPHALHSEGHQDSMGLCLYLALSEELTKDVIDLVILDDVVMSVDAEHRRNLCRLLAQEFPDRQFLITTHDKTWASQLNSEGVVTSKNMIEFFNWQVDTGPQVNYEVDMWDRVAQDVQSNDIPSAAARLRRGSERFFGSACDALQAPVIYKANGRWELGDFMPAAVGELKKLIKKAKAAAQSWQDKDVFDELNEIESTIRQIYVRTNAEQWAVNASVHYNEWANLSPNDFRPVMEAFQDLFHVFVCNRCNGMIHVVTNGMKKESVRCNCGQITWNLIKKK